MEIIRKSIPRVHGKFPQGRLIVLFSGTSCRFYTGFHSNTRSSRRLIWDFACKTKTNTLDQDEINDIIRASATEVADARITLRQFCDKMSCLYCDQFLWLTVSLKFSYSLNAFKRLPVQLYGKA